MLATYLHGYMHAQCETRGLSKALKPPSPSAPWENAVFLFSTDACSAALSTLDWISEVAFTLCLLSDLGACVDSWWTPSDVGGPPPGFVVTLKWQQPAGRLRTSRPLCECAYPAAGVSSRSLPVPLRGIQDSLFCVSLISTFLVSNLRAYPFKQFQIPFTSSKISHKSLTWFGF